MTVIDLRNERFPVRDLSITHQIDFRKSPVSLSTSPMRGRSTTSI